MPQPPDALTPTPTYSLSVDNRTPPPTVTITFSSPEAFQHVLHKSKRAYDQYLRDFYTACIGLTPPINTVVIVPTYSEAVEQKFVGTIQHPELNGHPLGREHLPMLAAAQGKDVARLLADSDDTTPVDLARKVFQQSHPTLRENEFDTRHARVMRHNTERRTRLKHAVAMGNVPLIVDIIAES